MKFRIDLEAVALGSMILAMIDLLFVVPFLPDHMQGRGIAIHAFAAMYTVGLMPLLWELAGPRGDRK
jgi:hypothetical protein